MLPDEHHVFIPRHVMPQFAFPNPLGHAPSTATGAHAVPIQPIVDAVPRHIPPDAQVLGSSSIQSQIDSLQAAHAQGIASLQSQIDALTKALGVPGQRFIGSQNLAASAGSKPHWHNYVDE